MTVQLIPAYDNNPPKFRRLPKPRLTKGLKRYLQVMVVLTLILAVVNGLSVPSRFLSGFFKAIGFMLLLQLPIMGVIAVFYKYLIQATNGSVVKTNLPIHDYYKKAFINQGYQVDYESEGIVIDSGRRKIGFTQSPAGIDPQTRIMHHMLVCDFNDVLKWSLNNTQHKTQVAGTVSAIHDNFTGVTTVHHSPGYERVDLSLFRIHVEINYPSFPMQDFRAKNEADAQNWMARLSSLINNQQS